MGYSPCDHKARHKDCAANTLTFQSSLGDSGNSREGFGLSGNSKASAGASEMKISGSQHYPPSQWPPVCSKPSLVVTAILEVCHLLGEVGNWVPSWQLAVPGQAIEWLPWQGRASAHSKGGAVQKPMWTGPATVRKVGNPPLWESGRSCSGHSWGWRVKVHSRQLGVGSFSGASQAGSTPCPRVQPPLVATGPPQATPAWRVPAWKACHLRCAGLFRPCCLLFIGIISPP